MTEVPTPNPTEGSDLAEQTDWMTFTHQQLYDMVNQGVDLSGAGEVAASWTTLADTLTQMSQTLSQALAASADGWQGSAADQARTSIGTLVTWANNTGENAATVAGCVNRQSDALQAARTAMPAPVTTPPLPPVTTVPVVKSPTANPVNVAHPGSTAHTTTASFSQPPLTSPGPVQVQTSQYEAHQQAARVMQQYQQSSAINASTIPQFAAPTNPVNGPVQSPPVGQLPPTGPPGSPQPTTPVFGGAGSNPPADEVEPGRIGTAEPALGSGSSSGASGASAASQQPSTSTTSETTTQGSRAGVTGGGMGGAGARRGEDQEHKRKYWQDDDGIFDLPLRATPPVIGEERRG
ncbi:MAG TPA: PPE domain-containing protein [Pseudonocardiaceae bacterium]|jgi:hypothetical protein|nr:PPE domain-containing protein [Pseudonocardiaceae bacterium]